MTAAKPGSAEAKAAGTPKIATTTANGRPPGMTSVPRILSRTRHVGAVLLWTSPTWRVRDKILGTLVIPGGLPFAVVVAIFGVPAAFASALPGLAAVIEVVLLIGPIYTAVHLFRVSAKATGPLTWRRPG